MHQRLVHVSRHCAVRTSPGLLRPIRFPPASQRSPYSASLTVAHFYSGIVAHLTTGAYNTHGGQVWLRVFDPKSYAPAINPESSMPYSFDTQTQTKATDLKTYADAEFQKLILGEEPISNLPQIYAKFKSSRVGPDYGGQAADIYHGDEQGAWAVAPMPSTGAVQPIESHGDGRRAPVRLQSRA